MELNLNEFENLNLYSNKSMEQILASIVNRSSNACLVNVFEDAVVLLDHNSGQFYFADYKFNRDKLTVKFENFEAVELEEDTSNFEAKVFEFFDSEEINPLELAENYRNDVLEKQTMLKELINSAMSRKNFDNVVDYNEIVEAKKEISIESFEKPLFHKYVERLETHPLMEAKYFNWKDPISVSLVETESQRILNSNAIASAHNLWKNSDFKKAFNECCEVLVEDVEDGTEMLSVLFKEYPQIHYLDKADRKTVFGKILISNQPLRDDINDILKGIDILFEKFELSNDRNDFLKENIINEQDEENEVPTGGQAQEKEEPAPEPSKDENETIIKDLKKIAEKVEDEKTKEKLDKIISELEKGSEEGTKPSVVKEAVAILRM